ncbi:TK protein kinase [Sphaeroforma arctica JP610]|uniref:TK protein kinase n=1 Tax=Sphaeroforma arctica JP610 TaxID=667725 RepID=A0A0L0G2W8_9EUKA|nr:TK protein kinase [Sphaeroforma arctica JP610]KNC83477.1 TK protein kinase [Sphaeroforma arctica JP610]|eukprot:XP_014157379.1 TK protein kinase [Sphaeroforma arctica JP610]
MRLSGLTHFNIVFALPHGSDDSLSAGAIIGIVACVLLVLCFVAGLIAFCMYRKRQRQAKKARIHPLFNLPANLLKRINDADAMVVRQKARESGEDIDPKRLKVVQKLGGGNFGEVFFAMLKDSHGRESPVAVKQLNDRQSEEAKDVFFEEANLMKSINHANVLDCIGISKGPPGAIIMDIMVLGDLHTYLSSQFDREEPVTIAEKYHLSYQIASGMNYLQSQGIVHRDLATRNCMLSLAGPNTLGYPTLKVADFGLSRVIDADTSDYVMESKTSLPFRWLSPRAMLEGRFSSASDVWSYGVTLWELFSNAEEIPYKGVNMFAILSKLQAGDRLERPDQCPKDAYDLMSACWKIKPENRPEFDTLERDFAYLFVPQCSVPVMVETSPDGSIVIIEGRDKRKFMDTGRLVAEGRVMGYDEEPEVPVYDDVNFKSDESTKKLNGQNSHGLAKGYENVHGADAKNKADELYDDVHGANLPSMARDYSNMPPSRGSLMPDEPEKLYNWSGAKLGDTAVSSPQRNLPIDSLARMLKDGDEAHLV